MRFHEGDHKKNYQISLNIGRNIQILNLSYSASQFFFMSLRDLFAKEIEFNLKYKLILLWIFLIFCSTNAIYLYIKYESLNNKCFYLSIVIIPIVIYSHIKYNHKKN